jgi:hypothetical protein
MSTADRVGRRERKPEGGELLLAALSQSNPNFPHLILDININFSITIIILLLLSIY